VGGGGAGDRQVGGVPIYLLEFYITVEMEEQVRLRLRELVIFYQEGVEVLEMLEMPQHL
jgi:hypothetical protein